MFGFSNLSAVCHTFWPSLLFLPWSEIQGANHKTLTPTLCWEKDVLHTAPEDQLARGQLPKGLLERHWPSAGHALSGFYIVTWVLTNGVFSSGAPLVEIPHVHKASLGTVYHLSWQELCC